MRTRTTPAPVTTPAAPQVEASRATTPEGRLLTAALVVGPLVYLAADSAYAVRGWNDQWAGLLHVVGAVLYGLVVLRVATCLPAQSRLRAALVLVGALGAAGNVAYGFEAVHMSWGDVQLVDRSGAANIIKLLGLFFPASLLLVAAALWRLGVRWQGLVVFFATLAWPIAHIGNIPGLAVPVNIALVVALGGFAWSGGVARIDRS